MLRVWLGRKRGEARQTAHWEHRRRGSKVIGSSLTSAPNWSRASTYSRWRLLTIAARIMGNSALEPHGSRSYCKNLKLASFGLAGARLNQAQNLGRTRPVKGLGEPPALAPQQRKVLPAMVK